MVGRRGMVVIVMVGRRSSLGGASCPSSEAGGQVAAEAVVLGANDESMGMKKGFCSAAFHPPRSPTGGRPNSPKGLWVAGSTAGLYGDQDAKSSETSTRPREPQPPRS